MKLRVLTALLVWLFVACGSDGVPFDAAVAVASDDSQFATGQEAGEGFARIAQHLNDAGEACDRERQTLRCSALSAASGYAQVLAVRVLRCTAPGRFEARTRMAEYLRVIDRIDPEDHAVPEPPALPDCS